MDPFGSIGDARDIRILIVDDREENLVSIETILEKENYTLMRAESGRAALRTLLQRQDFSLILMDVQMPDMNGFETATMIYEREKLREIPIIFITAHHRDDEQIFKGYRVGAVDYIYKPVAPDLLRAKVGVFAELYQKNLQLRVQENEMAQANRILQREINERKASERKISLLNDRLLQNIQHLKAVNEELDRFAYVASHDLQEPIRKILIFTDKILTGSGTGEDTEKYLRKIRDSSAKMQHFVRDLLSFSRHELHSEDFIRTDLNLLVSDVLGDLEVEIDNSKAKISVGPLPEIWAIPSLMRQMFQNLLQNAMKFRRDNSVPEISIYAETSRPDIPNEAGPGKEDTVYDVISIMDNGIGFDPKYADEIFVLFKRLHPYNEFQGSGVGLSICKKIIEKHRGFITTKSKDGEGSTFFIGIPQKKMPLSREAVMFPSGGNS